MNIHNINQGTIDIKKPNKVLPESPRKILEKLVKLKKIKIKILKAMSSKKVISFNNSILPEKYIIKTILNIEISDKPEHSPSSPSIKLKEFVSPITQITVNINDKIPSSRFGIK